MRKPFLIVVADAAIVGLAAFAYQLQPSSAATGSAIVALNVSSGGTCDDAAQPTECTVPASSSFTLAVNVLDAPTEGHVAIQTKVDYASLVYKPTVAGEDEVTINACDYPGFVVRSPGMPTGTEGTVEHGMSSGFTPPFTTCFFEGTVVQVTLSCPADFTSHEVDLIPLAEGAFGTGFKLPDLSEVSAKIAVRPLKITCGEPSPTPTPTTTQTPTTTHTPAITQTPTITPVPPSTNTPGPPTQTPTAAPATRTLTPGSPAPTASVTPTPTDAPCADDAFEENDAQGEATAVTPPVQEGNLRVCPGDDDWYSFPLTAGTPVQVDVTFTDAEGDVDAFLYDESGDQVTPAISVTDGEKITYTSAEAGTFSVQLTLFADAGTTPGNTYKLQIEEVAPQATPTHTPVPASSSTPAPATGTPPPGTPGDVDCNNVRNSIDSALILQFDVDLIASLACPQNGDLNDDAAINSIDAAVVLQCEAALFDCSTLARGAARVSVRTRLVLPGLW